MESRQLNVTFNKAGSGSITTRLTLPKKWFDTMEINQDERGVIATFDGEEITIKKERNTMKLYNENEITVENVLEMLREENETINDDMTENEKAVIKKVANQNYEGCDEDLEYLTEKLQSHDGANWQTCYDILSKGNWYYMENEQCECE